MSVPVPEFVYQSKYKAETEAFIEKYQKDNGRKPDADTVNNAIWQTLVWDKLNSGYIDGLEPILKKGVTVGGAMLDGTTVADKVAACQNSYINRIKIWMAIHAPRASIYVPQPVSLALTPSRLLSPVPDGGGPDAQERPFPAASNGNADPKPLLQALQVGDTAVAEEWISRHGMPQGKELSDFLFAAIESCEAASIQYAVRKMNEAVDAEGRSAWLVKNEHGQTPFERAFEVKEYIYPSEQRYKTALLVADVTGRCYGSGEIPENVKQKIAELRVVQARIESIYNRGSEPLLLSF